VEGPHGELSARLADRLGGDDAHRFADVDARAPRQVTAVAGRADAGLGFADEDGADLHRGDAGLFDAVDEDLVEVGVGLDDDRVRARLADVLGRGAAQDALAERDQGVAALDHRADGDAAGAAAVLLEMMLSWRTSTRRRVR
jgi:hypothetical protein